MQKKNKKHVFIVTIVLLAIFLPLGLAGFILYLEGAEASAMSKAPQNINREFSYSGFLYFYDENERLLGVYECKNRKGYCGYAFETMDDNLYELNYYNDTTIDEIQMINDKYAFIVDTKNDKQTDDDKIYLYDIVEGKTIVEVNAVKNYTIGLENDHYIIKKDGNWGVLSLASDNPVNVVPFNYEFIGVADNKNEDELLISDKYAVLKESEWYIIDNNNAELSAAMRFEVADYNGNYIITKSLYYYLHNYAGDVLYEENGYVEISFTGNYINLLDRNNFLKVIDPASNKELTPLLEVPSGTPYSVTIQGGKLVVDIDGKVTNYDI